MQTKIEMFYLQYFLTKGNPKQEGKRSQINNKCRKKERTKKVVKINLNEHLKIITSYAV